MPWEETLVMEERVRFVVESLRCKESFSSLCRRYGISRKTGYKWRRRYESAGELSSLADQPRRPHQCPWKTPEWIEDRVVSLRHEYGWGAAKLQVLLGREGIELGRSTVHRILSRRGLLDPALRVRPATQRFERSEPQELLQMDFKGELTLPAGLCHPLSVIDDHSRYAVSLRALPSQETEGVLRTLIDLFEAQGVPQSLLTDHGSPWWSTTSGYGLTRLGVFLIRQGVDLIFSGIRHPQTQGKVERFHRTLKSWLQRRRRAQTLQGFQDLFDAFVLEYNEIRPHEALDFETPSSRYRPSARLYNPDPEPWSYPEGSEVRRVSGNGAIFLQGRYRFVSHALPGRQVRLERFEQRLLVSYRHMLIREIDLVSGSSTSVLRPHRSTGP